MLSKETRKKIKIMVQDESLGDEIIARMSLLQITPTKKSEVRKILRSFDLSLNDKIAQIFKAKMANYDHGECGNEIANGLNGVVVVLQEALEGKDLTKSKERLDGEMDKISFEALAIAISSIDCAKNFNATYNNMIKAVSEIILLSEDKVVERTEIPVEILVDAKQDRVHVEGPSRPVVRKRIHFRKNQ